MTQHLIYLLRGSYLTEFRFHFAIQIDRDSSYKTHMSE